MTACNRALAIIATVYHQDRLLHASSTGSSKEGLDIYAASSMFHGQVPV
jgi:hypothetical protein